MFNTEMLAWLFVLLLLGSMWYAFDKHIGIKIYRWWYDLTHKDPLSASAQIGFIYNQKAKPRFAAAVLLAVLQSILNLAEGGSSPVVEFISVFLEIPVIMTGFYLGPWVDRLWSRRDELLDTVDKIESGDLKLKTELKEASQKAVEKVKDAFEAIAESAQAELANNQQKPLEQQSQTKPAEIPESPTSLMSGYLRRGGDSDNDR